MSNSKDSEQRSSNINIAKSPWSGGLERIRGYLYVLLLAAFVVLLMLYADQIDTLSIVLLVAAVLVALGGIVAVWIHQSGIFTWMALASKPAKAMARGDTDGAERALAKAVQRARRFSSNDHRRAMMLSELASFLKNVCANCSRSVGAAQHGLVGGCRDRFMIE
jgi:hypothetical protein